MSTHTSPDEPTGYTTTGSEKMLAAFGIAAGLAFVLVCVDLISGGRLSAPARAVIPTALEEVVSGDGADD